MKAYDVLHFRMERHEDDGIYYTLVGIEEAIITDGETIEEALRNLKEAVEVHLDTENLPRLEISFEVTPAYYA